MGCDVFGFISGSAPAKFQLFDDGQVAAAGAMLGPFHDASRGSSLAGAARRGVENLEYRWPRVLPHKALLPKRNAMLARQMHHLRFSAAEIEATHAFADAG